jgi:hypothetical protein
VSLPDLIRQCLFSEMGFAKKGGYAGQARV